MYRCLFLKEDDVPVSQLIVLVVDVFSSRDSSSLSPDVCCSVNWRRSITVWLRDASFPFSLGSPAFSTAPFLKSLVSYLIN